MAVTMKNAVFGMLRRVALVRTDVLEERSASIIRVTRIGELRTALAVTNNRRALGRNTKYYYCGYSYFESNLLYAFCMT
jgi:hypothetical protein